MSVFDEIVMSLTARRRAGAGATAGIIVSPEFKLRLLAESDAGQLRPEGDREWTLWGMPLRVVEHMPVDWAWDDPVKCCVCGRAVEDTRRFNAIPICQACEPVRTLAEWKDKP